MKSLVYSTSKVLQAITVQVAIILHVRSVKCEKNTFKFEFSINDSYFFLRETRSII